MAKIPSLADPNRTIWAVTEEAARNLEARLAGVDLTVEVEAAARTSTNLRPSRMTIKDGVAVIPITGFLQVEIPWYYDLLDIAATTYDEIIRDVRSAVSRSSVERILLRMDSPGGEVSSVLDRAGKTIAWAGRQKPVSVEVQDLAASGAYWLASQAGTIAAPRLAMIGSIGIFAVITDYSGAYDKLGIKIHVVRSGAHKGMGRDGVTDKQLAAYQDIIDGMAAIFIDAVAVGRGLDRKAVEKLADGRAWLAAEARANGLIDSVLEEPEAVSGSAGVSTTASEVIPMPKFEDWLQARGLDVGALSDDDQKELRSAYEALKAVREPGDEPGAIDAPSPNAEPAKAAEPPPDTASAESVSDAVQRIRAEAAAEIERINQIQAVKAEDFPGLEEAKLGELRAQAIKEGWSPDKLELKCLRSARPKAPNPAGFGTTPASADVIEAALCQAAGLNEPMLVKAFGERTMEEAHKTFLGRMGIQAAFVEAGVANGLGYPRGGFSEGYARDVLLIEQRNRIMGATGFTTVGLSGILSNVAHKSMLGGYERVAKVIPIIFKTGSVSDFKQHTRYRLVTVNHFEKVGADGMLQHGEFSEDSYTQQIDTYGEMVALTRVMIVNDDLGAFTGIPTDFGRHSAIRIERVGAALILANASSFFSAGHSNYATGAATALGITALNTAVKMFEEMKDAQGEFVLILPKFVLVPPAIKADAQNMYDETKVNETTTANKPRVARNPHAGKYTPVSSPYLGSSTPAAVGSGSDTGWYLLADPNDVACWELAYLNGKAVPTIETGQISPELLGIWYRAFHDFGVAQQDYRGGVKMKGE